MSQYEAAAAMHQYYRDVLTREFTFPDLGTLPHEIVQQAIGSCDTALLAERLFSTESGLSAQKDLALKLMLMVVSQAGLALDQARDGHQAPLQRPLVQAIRNGLQRVLTLDPNEHYVVMAVQLLYRIGAIEVMFELIRQVPWLVEKSVRLQKILAMVHTVADNYEGALPYLGKLFAQAAPHDDPLVTLMGVACAYKLGERPDAPVDFATLSLPQADHRASLPPLHWLIEPDSVPRSLPTVLIACDENYFFKHALALLYSLHATNRGELLVHLHLYAPNPSIKALVEKLRAWLPELGISATFEVPVWTAQSARVHFAARRFVVASQLLSAFEAPVMVVDADSLFRESWKKWSNACSDTADVVFTDLGVTPFWERVTGGFLYLRPTPTAARFIDGAAAFIQRNLERGNALWFLDQIALSVGFDEVLVPAGQQAWQACARAMDLNHGAGALLWVVTTVKGAEGAYQGYKRDLLAAYGQTQIEQPGDAFRVLSERSDTVSFVQIGAMDGKSYDPIYPYVKRYGWRGVLVEPLPDMLVQLKENYAGVDGLIFENVAVSEQAGTFPLYRVRQETILEHNLPHWLGGMSTFSQTKLKDYDAYVSVEQVPGVPLGVLLDRNRIERVDVLQIDTEGFDYKVFRQFDFSQYRPSVINIEVVNLGAEELSALQCELVAHGYVYFFYEMDLMALDMRFFNSRLSA